MLENKQKRTPVYLTEEEVEMWKWVCKYYNLLDYARKLRYGSTTLHTDINGSIRAEYRIWSVSPLDKPNPTGIQ